MTDLIFNFRADDTLADSIARGLDCQPGRFSYRKFPDGESYIRIEQEVYQKSVAVITDLSHPDEKFLSLVLFVETLKDLGAGHVGLIAPYLPYMRQDKRFLSGEGITSRYFAGMVSHVFDWLVTIDPHLHRFHDLNEIYTIPTAAAHAAPLISNWITDEIDTPLLIGPDSESKQWVREVAGLTGAPFLVLEKIRRGDRDVEISMPEAAAGQTYTPVLIDDIISSGNTMLETIGKLIEQGFRPPACIAVHGLFTDDTYAALLANTACVVTANTIPHASNNIDISGLLVETIQAMESN